MQIEIPDEVYQVFVRKHGEGGAEGAIRATIHEAAGAVNQMEAHALAAGSSSPPRGRRCTLTACRRDLLDFWWEAMMDRDTDCRLRERYLCIDVDDFMDFVDCNGLSASDGALRGIGEALRARYGDDAVFRTGGDEFVVALGDAPVVLPVVPKGVTLNQCVLDVDVRGGRRHHHAANLLRASLCRAMVEGTPEGGEIICRYPAPPANRPRQS